MNYGYYQLVRKTGITTVDLIVITVLIISIIPYMVLISQFPYDEYKENPNDPKFKNKILFNNIYGFTIGLIGSYIIASIILREYRFNIYINSVTFLISLTLIILYYYSQFTPNNTDWIKYNYAVIPLASSMFFINQYSLMMIMKHLHKIMYNDDKLFTKVSDYSSIDSSIDSSDDSSENNIS
jgi:cell division protein FtsW (lipid II flippase)